MSTTATATANAGDGIDVLQKQISDLSPSDQWLADLYSNGYVVIKGAIASDRASAYQANAFDWLRSFDSKLDLNDPSTWVNKHLPVQSKINTFTTYGVCHEKFMWDVRQEPQVLDAFMKIWSTDELLVSFDALNITLPNRTDRPPRGSWPHVDQSPYKKGMHCVQGIVNLSHAGPEDGSLVVFPGSHLLVDEFFNTQLPESEWVERDFYPFTEEHMEWFAGKGMKAIKVLAEPGDLILWDSRTVHWGAEPTENGKTIRTVIYASYAPASHATEEALKTKQEIFKAWGSTTHWAATNLRTRDTRTFLEDGTQDPRDREEPLEKPEMTDKLLRLAGVKPYST